MTREITKETKPTKRNAHLYCPSNNPTSDIAVLIVLIPSKTKTIGARQHKEAKKTGNPVTLINSRNFINKYYHNNNL